MIFTWGRISARSAEGF